MLRNLNVSKTKVEIYPYFTPKATALKLSVSANDDLTYHSLHAIVAPFKNCHLELIRLSSKMSLHPTIPTHFLVETYTTR